MTTEEDLRDPKRSSWNGSGLPALFAWSGLLRCSAVALLTMTLCWGGSEAARAASAAQLDRDASASLSKLYEANTAARMFGKEAKGILVFPRIVKAGFLFGGQLGEGVLRKGTASAAYYNTIAASYGLQAGVQSFGYALFFMDDASLKSFETSKGFEVGVGPSVVIVDKGVANALTTTTVRKGIYAFIFDQAGLMAGIGIQGSKITRISK